MSKFKEAIRGFCWLMGIILVAKVGGELMMIGWMYSGM